MAEPHMSSNRATRKKGGIVNRVKETATAQLTTQKDRGTDALDRVAEAVRSSTEKLREDRLDLIAGYIDKAADQIENWSLQLRAKDVDQLLSDLQRLARQRPTLFIGSAFALGVLGGRFLKSTSQADSSQADTDGQDGESRRTRYGGTSSASTVHDHSARGDDDVAASEMEISEREPRTESSGSSGTEGGRRSTRGRRSTSRSGQSRE